MKILLVEDDSALRGALEELLCREGYDVVKASNVRSAKAAVNSDIDLVMLDVGLPDGDGVNLCRQWRSEGVQIPILFLTAKDEELDVVRGLDAGGNDYVTKPFRILSWFMCRFFLHLRIREIVKMSIIENIREL